MRGAILLGLNLGLGWADLGRLRWNHLNLTTGQFSMPRGKTGVPRKGWLWPKTREVLERIATLKHNREAIEKEGDAALVLLTRTGLPIYRESLVGDEVLVVSALASHYTKLCKRAKVKGLRFYRLRHTLKTLGKRARDKDALNLMMGHREGTIGEAYDHEDIGLKRVRRVARKVHRRLWPTPKLAARPAGEG